MNIVSEDPKNRSAEKAARLRLQAFGVIVGKPAPAATPAPPLPLAPDTRPDATRPPRPDGKPPVDDSATVPVPLLLSDTLTSDATPPPLPPSPASAAAEVWLEEAATRPSAFTDIASQVSPGPAAAAAGIASPALDDPIAALRQAHEQAMRSMRAILALATLTAFVLGIVLGALLFR